MTSLVLVLFDAYTTPPPSLTETQELILWELLSLLCACVRHGFLQYFAWQA